MVQNRMSTHLGGVEKDRFPYDFIGNVTKRKTDFRFSNGTRSRLLFDGGYVSVSNSGYHFFITDHLGSVRVVANTSGTAFEGWGKMYKGVDFHRKKY